MVVAALNTLAVTDTQVEFARRLAAYAEKKAGYPFTLQVFSSADQLLEYAEKKQPEAVLLARELYRKKDWIDCRCPLFLLGNSFEPVEGVSQIFRYQDAESILKDVLAAYTQLVPGIHAGGIKGRFHLCAVTDVGEEAATEWLALARAKDLAKTEKVLFANFRAWPVTAELSGDSQLADLGELLYVLCEKKEELMGQLMTKTTGWQGIDLLPVAHVPADLSQVRIGDWKAFFALLGSDSPYTAVVVAVGMLIQPVEEFLELFDEVWLVEHKEPDVRKRLWQSYMGTRGNGRLTEKVKYLRLSPEKGPDSTSVEMMQSFLRGIQETKEETCGRKGS